MRRAFGYGLAPDGERIAVIENAEPGEPITELQLVLNCDEELKRLLPRKCGGISSTGMHLPEVL